MTSPTSKHEARAREIASAYFQDKRTDLVVKMRAGFNITPLIEHIAAFGAEVEAQTKREMMNWCAKRQMIQTNGWMKSARKAIAGDLLSLRIRVALIDEEPLEITQSAILASGDTNAE